MRTVRHSRPGLASLLLVLALAACSSSGGAVANGPAAASKPPSTPANSPRLTVTSTLDRRATLPERIHWQAVPSVPSADVSEVDFLIDGRLGWVEHHTPYFYGSDGNWLVMTFLKPGRHTFTVRVIGTEGQTARDTVQATVPKPPTPPAGLVGVWSRNIPGLSQDPGRWHIRINSIGWLFDDPNGGGQNQDVSYPALGKVVIRAAIEEPPYGSYNRGGAFCGEEPDPPGLYTYRLSDGGRMLTLKPVRKDCRQALLGGTWTRAGT